VGGWIFPPSIAIPALALTPTFMISESVSTLAARVQSGFCGWSREGELNPQGTKYRRILSPTQAFSNLLIS
jgi:hypothetical protein